MFSKRLRVLSRSGFLSSAHEGVGVDLDSLLSRAGGSHGVMSLFISVMIFFLVFLGLLSVSGKRIIDWHGDSQSPVALRIEVLSELGGGSHVGFSVSLFMGIVPGLFSTPKELFSRKSIYSSS
jgi:hypothetical protein